MGGLLWDPGGECRVAGTLPAPGAPKRVGHWKKEVDSLEKGKPGIKATHHQQTRDWRLEEKRVEMPPAAVEEEVTIAVRLAAKLMAGRKTWRGFSYFLMQKPPNRPIVH